ncbi:hypothetical protein KIF59_16435 [Enterobacter cloacae subsp. cloacae]|nr:hypothetical protein [Enterobacter cloacae subsp. cloacae]
MGTTGYGDLYKNAGVNDSIPRLFAGILFQEPGLLPGVVASLSGIMQSQRYYRTTHRASMRQRLLAENRYAVENGDSQK